MPDSVLKELTLEERRVYRELLEEGRKQAVFVALKWEQVLMYKKIIKWLVGLSVGSALMASFFFWYFSQPTQAQRMLLRQIQKERQYIRQERDSLRIEKEIFYGLKKRK